MEVVAVVIHREVTDDEIVWWAEADDVPGFSAAASSLEGLRRNIDGALAEVLGVPVGVKERFAAT